GVRAREAGERARGGGSARVRSAGGRGAPPAGVAGGCRLRGMSTAMPRPSVLLLDVMGTLVHDPFYVEIPRFFGMSLRELLAVKHPHAWVEFELDAIDEPTLLARFFADGRPVDGEGLRAAVRRAYRFLPGI